MIIETTVGRIYTDIQDIILDTMNVSTVEKGSSMDKVSAIFNEFYKVQDRWAEYGAYDSEPSHVMTRYLLSALGFSDKPCRLPITGDDWQLYACSMKCGQAARSLTAALKKLEKKLKNLPMLYKDQIENNLGF